MGLKMGKLDTCFRDEAQTDKEGSLLGRSQHFARVLGQMGAGEQGAQVRAKHRVLHLAA